MFDTSSSKMFKQYRGLFTNRWACGCFALWTIQQILEASSVVWLVFMTKQVTTGQPFLIYLLLYLTTLVVPYVPECLAYIVKSYWKQEAQRSFIQAFIDSNRSQIMEWSHKSIREEKLSILTTEGPNTLHALVDYVFDLYSYVLSVFLNILALSVVVEPLFSIAYGISIGVVLIFMKIKRPLQKYLTEKALDSRLALYKSLLKAWDNVLLGNCYNFKLWQMQTDESLNYCLKKNVELERFDQLLAIVISLLTSLPSLAVVFYFIYYHQSSMSDLTTFIVALPTLFLILSYTHRTLSLIFRWSMHQSKLISVYKAIEPVADTQLAMEKKITWPKIHLSSFDSKVSLKSSYFIQSYQELRQQTNQMGRLTLRGENGSGKSTLLMLLKNSLNEQAFFLPTQNQLSFKIETTKDSTGESLKKRLEEILQKVEVNVLLLDEWDANLDQENQEIISKLIDKLSLKKCVIEVRHR